MPESRNSQLIGRITRGDVISAQYLNNIGRAVNENSRALAGPKQQQALEQSDAGGDTITDFNFTEVSRSQTSKQVTDSNGDTHTIEQIDSVTLVNSQGQTFVFNFNNP